MKLIQIFCSSIAEVMRGMQSMEYVLPSIQRDFVWTEQQIEHLFDSLMRGFPINTFMFWKLNQETMQSEVKNLTFYKFLGKDIESNGESNAKIDNVSALPSSFSVVLDGQQRLTALYVGLCGLYASTNKYLYLNIEAPTPSNEDNLEYEFKFLTEQEASQNPDKWFKVHDIMEWTEPNSILVWASKNQGRATKYAGHILFRLRNIVHLQDRGLNAFLIRDADIDTVREIYNRTSNGGTLNLQ